MEKFLERYTPMTREQKEKIREEIVCRCTLVADCWLYPCTNGEGYGVKKINGKVITTSRFMLAYSTHESLNIALDACHDYTQCPYRNCCNPHHLYWATRQENIEHRDKKRREDREAQQPQPLIPLGHVTHEHHAEMLAAAKSKELGRPVTCEPMYIQQQSAKGFQFKHWFDPPTFKFSDVKSVDLGADWIPVDTRLQPLQPVESVNA